MSTCASPTTQPQQHSFSLSLSLSANSMICSFARFAVCSSNQHCDVQSICKHNTTQHTTTYPDMALTRHQIDLKRRRVIIGRHTATASARHSDSVTGSHSLKVEFQNYPLPVVAVILVPSVAGEPVPDTIVKVLAPANGEGAGCAPAAPPPPAPPDLTVRRGPTALVEIVLLLALPPGDGSNGSPFAPTAKQSCKRKGH
jgi:hypothetical protein